MWTIDRKSLKIYLAVLNHSSSSLPRRWWQNGLSINVRAAENSSAVERMVPAGRQHFVDELEARESLSIKILYICHM